MFVILSLVSVLTLASPSFAAAISFEYFDPCAKISGHAFADPAYVVACFRSFPANETIKENVLDVLSKTLNQFFTFQAEQLHSPSPFEESSVDLNTQIARIKNTTYQVSQPAQIDKSCSQLLQQHSDVSFPFPSFRLPILFGGIHIAC